MAARRVRAVRCAVALMLLAACCLASEETSGEAVLLEKTQVVVDPIRTLEEHARDSASAGPVEKNQEPAEKKKLGETGKAASRTGAGWWRRRRRRRWHIERSNKARRERSHKERSHKHRERSNKERSHKRERAHKHRERSNKERSHKRERARKERVNKERRAKQSVERARKKEVSKERGLKHSVIQKHHGKKEKAEKRWMGEVPRCELGEWTSWSKCSQWGAAECGGGSRKRTRRVWAVTPPSLPRKAPQPELQGLTTGSASIFEINGLCLTASTQKNAPPALEPCSCHDQAQGIPGKSESVLGGDRGQTGNRHGRSLLGRRHNPHEKAQKERGNKSKERGNKQKERRQKERAGKGERTQKQRHKLGQKKERSVKVDQYRKKSVENAVKTDTRMRKKAVQSKQRCKRQMWHHDQKTKMIRVGDRCLAGFLTNDAASRTLGAADEPLAEQATNTHGRSLLGRRGCGTHCQKANKVRKDIEKEMRNEKGQKKTKRLQDQHAEKLKKTEVGRKAAWAKQVARDKIRFTKWRGSQNVWMRPCNLRDSSQKWDVEIKYPTQVEVDECKRTEAKSKKKGAAKLCALPRVDLKSLATGRCLNGALPMNDMRQELGTRKELGDVAGWWRRRRRTEERRQRTEERRRRTQSSRAPVSLQPGCYFKQANDNGKCGGKLTTWTRDKNATSASATSEPACLGRKSGHDKHCGADSKWRFIPPIPSVQGFSYLGAGHCSQSSANRIYSGTNASETTLAACKAKCVDTTSCMYFAVHPGTKCEHFSGDQKRKGCAVVKLAGYHLFARNRAPSQKARTIQANDAMLQVCNNRNANQNWDIRKIRVLRGPSATMLGTASIASEYAKHNVPTGAHGRSLLGSRGPSRPEVIMKAQARERASKSSKRASLNAGMHEQSRKKELGTKGELGVKSRAKMVKEQTHKTSFMKAKTRFKKQCHALFKSVLVQQQPCGTTGCCGAPNKAREKASEADESGSAADENDNEAGKNDSGAGSKKHPAAQSGLAPSFTQKLGKVLFATPMQHTARKVGKGSASIGEADKTHIGAEQKTSKKTTEKHPNQVRNKRFERSAKQAMKRDMKSGAPQKGKAFKCSDVGQFEWGCDRKSFMARFAACKLPKCSDLFHNTIFLRWLDSKDESIMRMLDLSQHNPSSELNTRFENNADTVSSMVNKYVKDIRVGAEAQGIQISQDESGIHGRRLLGSTPVPIKLKPQMISLDGLNALKKGANNLREFVRQQRREIWTINKLKKVLGSRYWKLSSVVAGFRCSRTRSGKKRGFICAKTTGEAHSPEVTICKGMTDLIIPKEVPCKPSQSATNRPTTSPATCWDGCQSSTHCGLKQCERDLSKDRKMAATRKQAAKKKVADKRKGKGKARSGRQLLGRRSDLKHVAYDTMEKESKARESRQKKAEKWTKKLKARAEKHRKAADKRRQQLEKDKPKWMGCAPGDTYCIRIKRGCRLPRGYQGLEAISLAKFWAASPKMLARPLIKQVHCASSLCNGEKGCDTKCDVRKISSCNGPCGEATPAEIEDVLHY